MRNILGEEVIVAAKTGEFPKRVQITCYCPITSRFGTPVAKPSLCAQCKGWEAWFEKQYQDECERLGITPEPTQASLI